MRYEYMINDDIALLAAVYAYEHQHVGSRSIEIIGDSRCAAAARTHGAQSSKYKYDVYTK